MNNLTLTIDQLINLLEEAKARAGGDIPVLISDYCGEEIGINEETTGMNPSDSCFFIGL